MSSEETTGQERPDAQAGGTTRGQRVLGVIGALLVLGLFGLLAVQGVTQDSEPDLQVVVTDSRQVSGAHTVRVQVNNSGGQTAEAVEVSGDLSRGGATVDTGSVTIDYVPAHSHRTATLVFSEDPEAPGVELEVSVDGYTSM